MSGRAPNFRHLPVLAIDPSKTAGFALWNPATRKIHHGRFRLLSRLGLRADAKAPHGALFRAMLTEISEALTRHGLERDMSLRVVHEAPAPGAARSADSISLSEGWGAVISLYCHDHGLVEPTTVVVNEWRSWFLPRKLPKALKAEARAWFKAEVMRTCESYGLHPEDDNVADAIGILLWFLDGGSVRQEARWRAEAQKAAMKRAQGKLDLGMVAR